MQNIPINPLFRQIYENKTINLHILNLINMYFIKFIFTFKVKFLIF